MTVIELQFLEAASKFFQRQNSQKINWEERRFQVASLILAGMCINTTPVSCMAKDAVMMADDLIEALNAPKNMSKCAELYQR